MGRELFRPQHERFFGSPRTRDLRLETEDRFEATAVLPRVDEIYKHFPSKDAMFDALCERKHAELFAALADALDALEQPIQPDAALRAGLLVWARTISSGGAALLAANRELPARIRRDFRTLLTEAIRAVEPRAPEATLAVLAGAIEGAAAGAGIAWRETGLIDEDEFISVLSRFIWDGLGSLQRELE